MLDNFNYNCSFKSLKESESSYEITLLDIVTGAEYTIWVQGFAHILYDKCLELLESKCTIVYLAYGMTDVDIYSTQSGICIEVSLIPGKYEFFNLSKNDYASLVDAFKGFATKY